MTTVPQLLHRSDIKIRSATIRRIVRPVVLPQVLDHLAAVGTADLSFVVTPTFVVDVLTSRRKLLAADVAAEVADVGDVSRVP